MEALALDIQLRYPLTPTSPLYTGTRPGATDAGPSDVVMKKRTRRKTDDGNFG